RDAWLTETVATSPEERAALARRFDLLELPRLEATARLRRARAGRCIEVDIALRAAVVQACVVTLDPVGAEIDEQISLVLGPTGGAEPEPEGGRGLDLIVDLDEPEPLDGDEIDVGELVAQQLSLALDPYPRSAGADAVVGEVAQEAGSDPATSPFAVLQQRG